MRRQLRPALEGGELDVVYCMVVPNRAIDKFQRKEYGHEPHAHGRCDAMAHAAAVMLLQTIDEEHAIDGQCEGLD